MRSGIGDQGSWIKERWHTLLCAMVLVGAQFSVPAAEAQTPRLSNGRLEPHATTNIGKDLQALAGTLTEPTWLGYIKTFMSPPQRAS